ncbi:MAG: carboxylic ester hydrolase [Alphaproteobacteria bacterium]|nr:carboxylic ester hydrolase [Alphaproteobacteria bacterium]
MRPLEVLLTLVNLATFAALVFPRWRASRAARILPFTALLVVSAQILLEGARWQMVPAYALSVLFLLISLAPTVKRAGAYGPLWRAVGYTGATFGAVVLALSGLLPLAFPVLRFPAPTGPHAIGTLTYHWVDAARPEIFTADPNDQRELTVQVWYPARANPSAPRAPYMRDGSVLAPVARLLHLPGWVFTHLKYDMTNAMPSAPMADGAEVFPVLIFSHGRGGVRLHNTFQVEELVSHGYVVAAIDHPYAAAGVDFPDGRRANFDTRMMDRRFQDRVVPFLAQDVSFTLNQLAAINQSDPSGILAGRLDLQRAGMFGVSLGGAVTAQACHNDARLRACLAMDVYMPADVVRNGLRQPTMWISRDADTMRREGWAQTDIDETQTTMRSVYESLPGDGYLVLVPNMFHQNLSDFPYFVASPLDVWLGLDGPIDARRAHNIINAYSRAFFDRSLKGVTAQPLLDGPASQYPDVLFEARRP